jgi:hypothetical protein
MANNSKQTSSKVASVAAQTLNNPNASESKRALLVQHCLKRVLRTKQAVQWNIKHLLPSTTLAQVN